MIKNTFHKLGIYSKKDLLHFCFQFIKFGIVGLSNTLISMVVYYLCIFIGMHYILSNSIAFVISVVNAYYWNSKCVFKKNDSENNLSIKPIIKVFISYGFTFVLSTILLYLWVDCLNISTMIAPLINLVITIPINFLLNKMWAFK